MATPCLEPTGPTMHGKFLVGMDRIELSPRVPKTRMLALHHTPVGQTFLSSIMSDMLQLVVRIENSICDVPAASLLEVVKLDDKLKHVGH